jgi:hypothetical protein
MKWQTLNRVEYGAVAMLASAFVVCMAVTGTQWASGGPVAVAHTSVLMQRVVGVDTFGAGCPHTSLVFSHPDCVVTMCVDAAHNASAHHSAVGYRYRGEGGEARCALTVAELPMRQSPATVLARASFVALCVIGLLIVPALSRWVHMRAQCRWALAHTGDDTPPQETQVQHRPPAQRDFPAWEHASPPPKKQQ